VACREQSAEAKFVSAHCVSRRRTEAEDVVQIQELSVHGA
jgi:hypothetical protein